MSFLSRRPAHENPLLSEFLRAAGEVILNKEPEFRLALTCFLARGHLLIEDLPGLGKTTFVKTLARLLGLEMGRVQFTNDLLPGDILGTAVFDPAERAFRFHRGPLFAPFVLIDELNRATPKTQSALLQAMEEGAVTAEGATHALPDPFFLVATQNPRSQTGTFALPESQLDRFLMRIPMGYPGEAAERALLRGAGRSDERLAALEPLRSGVDAWRAARAQVAAVHVSDEVARFAQALLALSRRPERGCLGLSPRAGLGLMSAARAWAWLEARDMVLPEDVQAVAPWVANHRIAPLETDLRAAVQLAADLVHSLEIA